MPASLSASTNNFVNLPTIPRAEMPYLSDLRESRILFSNQPEIIRSRIIFEQVVEKLHLDEMALPPSFSSLKVNRENQ
jgi:uncharacterized protein involved in exopolysaccharide biosynthesis